MIARGFMLIEIMLTVATSILAAIAGFALLARVESRVQRETELMVAADMACSALALIESGAATAENLHGSVQSDVISLDDIQAGAFVRDGRYRIEIESTPTQWQGLLQLDVTILDIESDTALYSVSQLVQQAGGVL